MTTLVIGLGNVDRADDAAGVLAVRRVRGGRRLERADCSDLIDLLDGEEDVVIIDAMRSGRPPGSIRRFELEAVKLHPGSFVSSHSFGLAETIGLAHALNRVPAKLTVFGIEASDVAPGGSVSPAVMAAAGDVASEIDKLVQ